MGLSYLIAGFIFFFLPNLSIIDILPDFIGCIFIIIGLNKISDLTPGLADARRNFFKVMYLDIAKFVLMFLVPYFSKTDGGMILIFSFTFLVLDLIFTLPAFKSLLNGFIYLGDRTVASSLFVKQKELSSVTSIFIVCKAFLAMFPDLAYISNPESSNVVSLYGGFYLSNFKTLLVAFNFLITGILGICWLFMSVSYVRRIKKDKSLIDMLKEQYRTTVLPNKGLFIRRGVKTAFSFITIGGLLLTDLYIDMVNISPDFIAAGFFLIAALILRKYCKARMLVISSSLFFAASVVFWAVMSKYAVDFIDVNIWTNMQAYTQFGYVNIANIIKCVLYLGVNISLFLVIKDIITKHTGTSVDELESVSRVRKQIQKHLYKQNIILLVMGSISCVSGIVRMILYYEVPHIGFIDFIVNLIYFAYLFKVTSSTFDSVEYRYL